jgi:hypothetical protein
LSDLVAAVRFRAGIGGEPVIADSRTSATCWFEATRWGAVLAAPTSAEDLAGAVSVDVGVGCCADIRSPSEAGVAPPFAFNISVQSDALLTWRLDPGVALNGYDRATEATIRLAGNARLLWGEEMAVGRSGEPGTWRSRLRVARDGWPIVCRDLAIGKGWPLWRSPVVLAGASAVTTLIVIDPGRAGSFWKANRAVADTAAGVALPLNGPGLQLLSWGEDLDSCRSVLEELLGEGRIPGWAAARWQTAGGLAPTFEPLVAL